MQTLTTSVLIPSFRRAERLSKCLQSIARQTCQPDEVIVVWQADDTLTKDTAEQIREVLSYPLRIVHNPKAGIVPAENLALEASQGQVIFLIDDDAVAQPEWIASHLRHYTDSNIGAVGGPANNSYQDGIPFPKRSDEPVGKLRWYGKPIGNMHDQERAWLTRSPQPVDHLVGYNLSVRRQAFDRFEDGLKPYWQMFELDVCLQVRAHGFSVFFDFANVVDHYPTNTVYADGRDGDISVKVYNAAYNHGFVLAKHSAWFLRPLRFLYLLGLGSVSKPGLFAFPFAVKRYGSPLREINILVKTWKYHIAGWMAGARARQSSV